jgi:two-component system response regulator
MQPTATPITILVADADADDRMLLQELFAEHNLLNPLHFVSNGEQFMQYLHRTGEFAEFKDEPLPRVILLNLKLPKLDAPAALAEIRQDPALSGIPVIVLTTSQTEQDILSAHDIGANAFISKPVTLPALFNAVSTTADCWIKVVGPAQNDQASAA